MGRAWWSYKLTLSSQNILRILNLIVTFLLIGTIHTNDRVKNNTAMEKYTEIESACPCVRGIPCYHFNTGKWCEQKSSKTMLRMLIYLLNCQCQINIGEFSVYCVKSCEWIPGWEIIISFINFYYWQLWIIVRNNIYFSLLSRIYVNLNAKKGS